MLSDLIRQEWNYHRERPFGRLVQLFVARIFRGAETQTPRAWTLALAW